MSVQVSLIRSSRLFRTFDRHSTCGLQCAASSRQASLNIFGVMHPWQVLAEPFYSDRREWWPVGTPPYYKSPFFHYHANTLGVQEVQPNIEVTHRA